MCVCELPSDLAPSSSQCVRACVWSVPEGGCAYFDKRFIHIEHGEMVTLFHSKFPVHSSL